MTPQADEENLDRIVDELLQRLRRGEKVDWPACFRQHPQHADELKSLAPLMESLVKHLLEKSD